jgi:hypothetical protein
LKNVCRFEVREWRPGIHYIQENRFATQLIESKRLEGTSGVQLLKALREGLKGEELRKVRSIPERELLSACLYTVLEANSGGLRDMRAMNTAWTPFR